MNSRSILAAAALLLALHARLAAQSNWSPDDVRFFQEQIYDRFFTEEKEPDGKIYLVAQRARAARAHFPKLKAAGTFRIFVLGGSVGMRFMESQEASARAWEAILPGKRVEAVSAAVPSYDSAREKLVLKEVLDYQPDLIVLFSGHNESPDPDWVPSRLAWLRSRLSRYQWFQALSRALSPKDAQPRLLSREQVTEAFAANVTEMARMASRRGVPFVVCILPRDIVDWPPASNLPLSDEAFFRAWIAWDQGNVRQAVDLFRAYTRAQPEESWGYYYLARCLRRLGDDDESKRAFGLAAEYSNNTGVGVRPSMNARLRAVAAAEGAGTADLEAAFKALSPKGWITGDLFDDHIHWRRSLNPLINATVADAARKLAVQGRSASLKSLSWDDGALRKERERAVRLARATPDLALSAQRSFLNGVWIWNPEPQRADEPSVAAFDDVRRWRPALLEQLLTKDGRQGIRRQLEANTWTAPEASRIEDLWPELLDNLGEMYRRDGQARKAVHCFDVCLSMAPARPLTRLRRAMALYRLGDRAGASREAAALQASADAYPEIRYYADWMKKDAPADE